MVPDLASSPEIQRKTPIGQLSALRDVFSLAKTETESSQGWRRKVLRLSAAALFPVEWHMQRVCEIPMMKISVGQPIADGQYVCYLDNPLLPAFTERKILMWFRGAWYYSMSDQTYRGTVYGWIGPLPVRKVTDFSALPKQEFDL